MRKVPSDAISGVTADGQDPIRYLWAKTRVGSPVSLRHRDQSDQGWNFIDNDAQLPGFYLGDGRDYVNFPLDANSDQRTVAYELGAETSFKAIGVDWSVRLIGRESQSDGDRTPSYAGGTVTALDATGKVLGNNRQIYLGSIPRRRLADEFDGA